MTNIDNKLVASVAKPQYSVVRADITSDADSIIGIWEQHHASGSVSRYEWMYRNNSHNSPSCFLMRNATGCMVGTIGVMLRKFWCGGTAITAGHTIDLIINSQHRTGGPAIQLQRAVLDHPSVATVDLLYGVPIRSAELIQRRAGFEVLAPLQRWMKPLNSSGAIRRVIPYTWLAGLLGAVIDQGVRIVFGELTSRSLRWSVTTCSSFDERHDALWLHARNRFPIIGERSAAYLRWRFGKDAPKQYRVMNLFDSNGRVLAGYIVYNRHDNLVSIADLLVLNTSVLRPLLAAFSRHMRAEGADAIEWIGIVHEQLVWPLRTCGFFLRKTAGNVVIRINPDANACLVKQASNWFLTDADRDA